MSGLVHECSNSIGVTAVLHQAINMFKQGAWNHVQDQPWQTTTTYCEMISFLYGIHVNWKVLACVSVEKKTKGSFVIPSNLKNAVKYLT